MNILLLVSAFLIVLALGCSAIFQTFTTATIGEKSFKGRLEAQKLSLNTIQEKQFKRAIARPPGKKKNEDNPSPSAEKKKKELINPRTKQNPWDESKLNLGPLLAPFSSGTQGKLYEVALALLEELYKGSAVERLAQEKKVDSFALRILDSIIEKAKENPEAESLAELFPDDLALQEIYYKMLKGTQNYDGVSGYPPLQDYFSFEKESKKKPIDFSLATAPLLKALLGPKITSQILEEEKVNSEKNRKFSALRQKGLEQVLLQFPEERLAFSDFSDLVYFETKKKPATSYMFIDPKTQISWKTKE